jgi:hypothetical protein
VVDGPLSAGENVTNEPTLAAEVGLESPTYMHAQNATNEPTDGCEIVTNVPTLGVEVGPDGPTYTDAQNPTNEPMDACENVTNEPTADGENMTNEPTLAADVGLESPTYMEAPEQNSTIELALAALGDGGRGVEMTSGLNDGDDSDFYEEIDRQKSIDWIRAGLYKMVAVRTETLTELNAESRRMAHEANAGRPSRRDSHETGQPAHRPTQQAERTKPRTTGTYGARTVVDSAELVNAGSGLTIRAGPAYD